jgi:hypothetical protein
MNVCRLLFCVTTSDVLRFSHHLLVVRGLLLLQVVLHKINMFTSQHLAFGNPLRYEIKHSTFCTLCLFFLSGQTLSCAKETQFFMTTVNKFYVSLSHLTEAFFFYPPVFFIMDMLIAKLKFPCISFTVLLIFLKFRKYGCNFPLQRTVNRTLNSYSLDYELQTPKWSLASRNDNTVLFSTSISIALLANSIKIQQRIIYLISSSFNPILSFS